MVAEQLVRRGIQDPKVLKAMRLVPRHRFVPEDRQAQAYEDRPLAIGSGQTISQPYIVALMTERLEVCTGAKVLEVGTGSGYQTAILAALGARVYSIERIEALAQDAQERLEPLGIKGVTIRSGDGTLGWAQEAPFDRIVVTAASPNVPEPLIQQMAEAGRMILPVGDPLAQTLRLVERHEGKLETKDLCGCLFVPLVGEAGWKSGEVGAEETGSE